MAAPSNWLNGLVAYQVKGGTVNHHPIPADGLAVPGLPGISLLQGEEEAHFASWTLPRAAELLARVCPWGTFWFAPGWQDSTRLREGPMAWAGTAWKGLGVAVVNSGRSGRLVLPTVAHEAFHLWECVMGGQPDLWASVLMDGMDWPDDYSASLSERGARAFAAYAAARMEGMNVQGLPLFDDLWNGRLAPVRHPPAVHVYHKAMTAMGRAA